MINRVLIVGYGSIGRRHFDIVRDSLPAAEIYLLVRRRFGDLPSHADGVFHELDAALAISPDLAILANPAPFHIEYASALIGSGCHVLIEKPISSDLTGTEALEAHAKAHKAICQIGYNLRYTPSLREFRTLLQEEAIGRCLSVRSEVGQYLPDWRPGQDYRQSVSASEKLGGGVLLELSHEIDYLRWIFGEVEWVSAWTGNLSDLQIDVEDAANLVLGFSGTHSESGIVASLSMDFFRCDTTRICVAIGENGSLRWNGLVGTVELYEKESRNWRELFRDRNSRDESYRAQWHSFLDAISHRAQPAVTIADGVCVLKVVAAAKRSAARQNQRIALVSQES